MRKYGYNSPNTFLTATKSPSRILWPFHLDLSSWVLVANALDKPIPIWSAKDSLSQAPLKLELSLLLRIS